MNDTGPPVPNEAERCDVIREIEIPFLAGTFATAYKGSISSLVIQNLSIHEVKEGAYEITGKILSLPSDEFEVFLLGQGNIINRSRLTSGEFSLTVSLSIINRSSNLQIDVRQGGIHIGTFLLKKDVRECSFIPALDLAEETHGFDLNSLVRSAGDAYGIVKKAEKITVAILSPRRDWRALSEDIADLSRALFWHNREGLMEVFPLLVHFALRCAISSSGNDQYRTSHNFIALIQDFITNEKDDARLLKLATIWMEGLDRTEGTHHLIIGEYREVVRSLHERLPRFDQAPLMEIICRGVEEDLTSLSLIPSTTVEHMQGYGRKDDAPPFDDSAFTHLTEQWRDDVLKQFAAFSEEVRERPSVDKFLQGLNRLDLANLRGESLVERFTEAVMREVDFIEDGSVPDLIIETTIIARNFPKREAVLIRRCVVSCFSRFLKEGKRGICRTVLDAFLNNDELSGEGSILINEDIGVAIGKGHDEGLIVPYCELLEKEPLAFPNVNGFSSDTWEEIVDPNHLKGITTHMRIIATDIVAFQGILRRLICHIQFGGVVIKDNALFAREVTRFLKVAMPDRILLDAYLFLKALPVYYREVGATGRLRDLTTEIDATGSDPLLYFLRKQSHCNASSNLITLVEGIFRFWLSEESDLLKGLVPDEIYEQVSTINIIAYRKALSRLFIDQEMLSIDGIEFGRLRHLDREELKRGLDCLVDVDDDTKGTIILLCEIYQLLCHKYLLDTPDDVISRKETDCTTIASLDSLIAAIEEMIEGLERDREVFLSPEETEANESLYYKRHIAFGIPSIMGSYSERKFDALGAFFRREAGLRLLLEELVVSCEKVEPSEEAVAKLMTTLPPWRRVLDLHGIPNPVIDELVEVSRSNDLSHSQIRDLIKGFQVEMTWIVERTQRFYRGTFGDYLETVTREELPPAYLSLEPEVEGFKERAADQFIRGLLTAITGLSELDRFLEAYSSLLTEAMVHHGDRLVPPLSPQRVSMDECFLTLGDLDALTANRLAPVIGTKAKNLFILKERGALVPEGFVLPATTADTENLDTYLRQGIERLEEKTGRLFGGGERPLFVSVRSGSYISMPGIMTSLLYCGMNEETCKALLKETGERWLAYDSYRRFIEHYGSIVYEIDIALFKGCMDRAKARCGYENKTQFTGEEMEELAMQYKDVVTDHGREIPHDVHRQLRETVEVVYRSWSLPGAVKYREAMKISDRWGTAVLVMEMIPGNREGSGTSVFFTRNPYTLEQSIFGDTKRQASGEDLVYGKASSMPISRYQAIGGEVALEDDDPYLFNIHATVARRVEEMMGGLPQEIEATYTTDSDGEVQFYILQTKRMEFRKGKIPKFKEVCDSVTKVIGQGVGINGGALSGIAVLTTDLKKIEALKERSPGMPLILIRRETNTRDVGIMPHVDGLLTILGGATSHAAVQAQKFNLSCVVGCKKARISEEKGEATIGSELIGEGDPVSIDGASGLVYRGVCFEIQREFV
jgi:pyruvate,orthophosphate dikinase